MGFAERLRTRTFLSSRHSPENAEEKQMRSRLTDGVFTCYLPQLVSLPCFVCMHVCERGERVQRGDGDIKQLLEPKIWLFLGSLAAKFKKKIMCLSSYFFAKGSDFTSSWCLTICTSFIELPSSRTKAKALPSV
ncbi:hypothetical protein ILYODFUR_000333 [Ilyodon furcidens]|uniref:Uncharacterized protein n=1 Tax=Ilyodon furcidens TaxID=33524 RepID=A0ABV0UZ00_9TELE